MVQNGPIGPAQRSSPGKIFFERHFGKKHMQAYVTKCGQSLWRIEFEIQDTADFDPYPAVSFEMFVPWK
jgi:hypothetical protein